MSIREKKEELLNAIKVSKEYMAFEDAKRDLSSYPDQGSFLDEYKQLLLESQLEQLLGGGSNSNLQEKMEVMYEELSKHEVINRYLIAEYQLKNVLTNIYKDLNHIVEYSESDNRFFFS
ncbi:hypothetical protein AZF37_02340 [endosymbiont 'TC1' of Trimyema compressum]|uniref:YlbF family regulator n=1 Tax=endosymbiont 'TC1' of Trimyema compressum TaxID=243899 RepID=UPI0007F07228|nr:YlbF family regulator [endosymbiont 'TC1' of Trimyema compressum]AMP20163.1 hypothetical protein AZF37_02340 [endosymbiont 'TC1' of Trimyema compressum]